MAVGLGVLTAGKMQKSIVGTVSPVREKADSRQKQVRTHD